MMKNQKNWRKIDLDKEQISRQQNNEVKNIPHIPSSEDTISLKSPADQGEESVSGDTPDPESDDDKLMNAHGVGEQQSEDIEHPKPLDIGGDVDKAEKNGEDN